MTYRELLKKFSNLSDEELDQDCSIWLSGVDEYMPLTSTVTTLVTDVLDKGHFVLVV